MPIPIGDKGSEIYIPHVLDGQGPWNERWYLDPTATLGRGVSVDLTGRCAIMADAIVSDETRILTHDHDVSVHMLIESSEVVIGEGAFVGMRCIILGKSIGEHAFVGAGSVVTKDIPAYQVWAGNPAHYIKDVTR